MNISEAIKIGNIIRDEWPTDLESQLNLYLGNGRFGGCFDKYGLMNNGYGNEARKSPGNTCLLHADYWDGSGIQDQWLPLTGLAWVNEGYEEIPESYNQELDLYDAQLNTKIIWKDRMLSTKVYFHPEERDFMAFELEFKVMKGIEFEPMLLDLESFGDFVSEADEFKARTSDKVRVFRIKKGTADSILAVKAITIDGAAELTKSDKGLEIHCLGDSGHFCLLIGSATYKRKEEVLEKIVGWEMLAFFEESAKQAWQRRWGNSYIYIPLPVYQAFWARSLYYVLCSYAPDNRCPAPPTGWSGNGWAFSFPQDLSFIHPALLRLGHFDIAKAWVEWYCSCINMVKDFTAKTFRAEGTMWVWEFPMDTAWKGFAAGIPNCFHYEIHNAAYPARMAWETSLYIEDEEWEKTVAWPVVRESVRFYASVLKKEADGTWGIDLVPSIGQDEFGGLNQKNYLCSLFSAQYCLQIGARMAKEIGLENTETAKWNSILKEGLAFKRLYNKKLEKYNTFENQGTVESTEEQKHPVQLNPIIFLPQGYKNQTLEHAYAIRYDLCRDSEKMIFQGWTLGAFLLAASHMGDKDGLERGLSEMVPSTNVSEDWIQFYESSMTSGNSYMPYFVTSHGLYLQAMNDMLLHEYWGELQIGSACPEQWEGVCFYNLHISGGIFISGYKDNNGWHLQKERGEMIKTQTEDH